MNSIRQVLLFLVLAASTNALQAAWSVEPSFYLRSERNDNIYFSTPDNELAVVGGTFSPAIKALMEGESQSLNADIDMQFIRYKDHDELDRDEGRADVNWQHATELSLYGIAASYASESSLDPSLDISGIIDQKVDIRTTNISPNWQYQFSERWSVILNLAYTDVVFDEPGFGGEFDNFKVVNFMNYTDKSASLMLSRELSELDTLSLTYYQSAYEGEGNGMLYEGPIYVIGILVGYQASERKVDYDYTVWRLGYEHRFDKTRALSVQTGRSDTAIESQIRKHLFDATAITELAVDPWVLTESNQSDRVFNFNYKQTSEISRFEVSLGHNRVASSTGGLDEVYTARIFYTSNITERFSWSMDINAENRQPEQVTSVEKLPDYTRINALPRANYILTKDWSISLGYLYSEMNIDSEAQTRESNAVFFSMNWRDPKLFSTN